MARLGGGVCCCCWGLVLLWAAARGRAGEAGEAGPEGAAGAPRTGAHSPGRAGRQRDCLQSRASQAVSPVGSPVRGSAATPEVEAERLAQAGPGEPAELGASPGAESLCLLTGKLRGEKLPCRLGKGCEAAGASSPGSAGVVAAVQPLWPPGLPGCLMLLSREQLMAGGWGAWPWCLVGVKSWHWTPASFQNIVTGAGQENQTKNLTDGKLP